MKRKRAVKKGSKEKSVENIDFNDLLKANVQLAESLEEEDEWLDDDGEDIAKGKTPKSKDLSDSDINAIYLKQATRIITQFNNFLIPNLVQSLNTKYYVNLRPEYQRRIRWDESKRSKLIESLLLNVPIPPVFLFEQELAKYEVVDGQQRLSTIKDFFNNEFRLTGLDEWPCLNRRIFVELPTQVKKGLMRRSLSAVILLAESVKTHEEMLTLRRNIFERLNTGGVNLSAQEIRNCMFGGKFNELLTDIARSKLFTKMWGIPPKERGEPKEISLELRLNKYYRPMLDNEIVLRVFALTEEDNIAGGMKRTLDRYMDNRKSDGKSVLNRLKRVYSIALKTAYDIFGENGFSLERKKKDNSKPLYDAIMVALYRLFDNQDKKGIENTVRELLTKKDVLIERRNLLISDTNAPEYELIVGRPNTKKATIKRIKLFEDLFREAIK